MGPGVGRDRELMMFASLLLLSALLFLARHTLRLPDHEPALMLSVPGMAGPSQ